MDQRAHTRSGALLEVAVLHARDVAGCVAGGADRIALSAMGDHGSVSPELAAAAAVIRASPMPVRVLLRLDETLTLSGGGLARLIALGQEYVALGAEGVEFGFLDSDLEIDQETCAALAAALPGVPWTFHRAVDAALEPRRAWRRLVALSGGAGLTSVAASGSTQGMDHGFEDLLALAEADPDIARLLMPGAGLLAEQVPWLARAGVRQFRLDLQVRPGGTVKSYVDGDFVRSWRRVIDALGGSSGASAG